MAAATCCSSRSTPVRTSPIRIFSASPTSAGDGAGEDANLNLPLARGTDWTGYADALAAALRRVRDFGPDVLLVSLGLDTFEGDPICGFKI